MPDTSEVSVLAFLIADHVIQDAITGKKSVIGMFNGIGTATVPCTHNSLSVFVALRGQGQSEIAIELVPAAALPGDKPMFQAKGAIEFSDPNAVVDLVFELRGTVFPEYGTYLFRIMSRGTMLRDRTFAVTEAPGDKGKKAQG